MIQDRVSHTDAPQKKQAYHHGDLRNAIIAQATARARGQGEKAIILREIAPELGVSATAAYRHFANRQQLVDEVSIKGFEAMCEWVEVEPVADADRDPGLAAYMDLRNASTGIVQFTAAEPAWARMMIETLGHTEDVLGPAQDVRAALQATVDRGIEAGMFRSDARIEGARVYWAGIDGLCSHAMFGVVRMGTPDSAHAISRTIDLCMTDLLTEQGLRQRDSVALPDGIATELPS